MAYKDCVVCAKRIYIAPSKLLENNTCSLKCRDLFHRRGDLDEFWSKVDKTESCWLWTGRIEDNGYASFRGKHVHRWIWLQTIGAIPQGMEVDHLCHTLDVDCHAGTSCMHRRCVRFSHLELVTAVENRRRIHTEPREACPYGHPYTDENSLVEKGRTTGKRCRTCRVEQNRTTARDWWRRKHPDRPHRLAVK